MTFSDVFAVVKELLVDWRLIVAFIVVLIYLNFVFYVSKYKKKQFKPNRIVKQKDATVTPPAADAQASEDSQEEPSEDDVLV